MTALLRRFFGPFSPTRLFPNRLVWVGLRELARGARTRRPAGFGAGLVLAIAGYMRSRSARGDELLFVKHVKEGKGLTIRVVRGGEIGDSIDV